MVNFENKGHKAVKLANIYFAQNRQTELSRRLGIRASVSPAPDLFYHISSSKIFSIAQSYLKTLPQYRHQAIPGIVVNRLWELAIAIQPSVIAHCRQRNLCPTDETVMVSIQRQLVHQLLTEV